VELQGRYDDVRKQGLGLVAITYDPPETLQRRSWRRWASTLPARR
jgi:hypothetical protein